MKLESVQEKAKKTLHGDLTKMKWRKAEFSHTPWMGMCVCHKLSLLGE
jgi:hypothetical protein